VEGSSKYAQRKKVELGVDVGRREVGCWMERMELSMSMPAFVPNHPDSIFCDIKIDLTNSPDSSVGRARH
jgi:hypothetical protein